MSSQPAEFLDILIANRPADTDPGEMVDDRLRARMLARHPIELGKVFRVDEPAHGLSGFGRRFPHIDHAGSFQPPFVTGFRWLDSESRHARSGQPFDGSASIRLVIVDHPDNSKPLRMAGPRVDEVRIVEPVITGVSNQDDPPDTVR